MEQELIKEAGDILFRMWIIIGIDKPHNHDEILKFIINDVDETANDRWSYDDVAIAFRRWIEAQSKNQP